MSAEVTEQAQCTATLEDLHRQIECDLPRFHGGEHRSRECWHDTPHRARIDVTTAWGRWTPDPDAVAAPAVGGEQP